MISASTIPAAVNDMTRKAAVAVSKSVKQRFKGLDGSSGGEKKLTANVSFATACAVAQAATDLLQVSSRRCVCGGV